MCEGCFKINVPEPRPGREDAFIDHKYVYVAPEDDRFSKGEYRSETTVAVAEAVPEDHVDICIFTAEGKTFSFKDITFTCDNETQVCFDYIAMSDGKTKSATFFKNRIVGYSLTFSTAQ